MEVERTVGYLVADVSGKRVGHVEAPLYGTEPDHADALAVCSDGLFHRHFIVPGEAVEAVDDVGRVISLSLEQRQLTRFL